MITKHRNISLYVLNFQIILFARSNKTPIESLNFNLTLSYIMQLAKNNSKKWVDYSDSSEEQQEERQPSISPPARDKPSQIQTQTVTSTQPQIDIQSADFLPSQIKRFEQCGNYRRDYFLQLVSKDQVFLDKKLLELKSENNSDILQIQLSQQIKGAWLVKARKIIAQKWVYQGLDQEHKIKVIVSLRNLRSRDQKNYEPRQRHGQRGGRRQRGDRRNGGQRREGGQRRQRGERGQRGDRRGRGRRDRDFNGEGRNEEGGERRRRDRDNHEGGEQKKKVYVDKATGKPPTNKQECEQRLIQQKERHYTKSEAEKMGMQLGNFRNKTKVQPKPSEIIQKQIKQQPIEVLKVKEQPFQKKPKQMTIWARKDRTQKPAQEAVKAKPKYAEKSKYAEKKEETEAVKEDKKKKYVCVDNLNQDQKKKTKQKSNLPSQEPTQQEKAPQKDFIEEDS